MQILKTLFLVLIAFFFGVLLGISVEKDSAKSTEVKKNTEMSQNVNQPDGEFHLEKGRHYVREMYTNKNDPFNKPVYDTVKVLDLKKSTSNDEIFVKWSTHRVEDSTVYFSTELNLFLTGLKELK